MRLQPFIALAAASALASGGFATTASADALQYRFDTVHTQVHASVTHMGLSNSTARLQVKDGVVRFDPDAPETASVDVTVAVESLDLGDATWKEHVSAAEWLDVASHPTARFVSTRVRPTGEDTFDIVGELTLKGVTRPLTLHATLNKAGPHPFSKKPTIGVSATGSLQRSGFGASAGIPAVSDEVKLRIELEASATE